MKKFLAIIILIFLVAAIGTPAAAQCSVCTKTAMQMGEKPAQGLNQGILYLIGMPFVIVAFIGYRWWKGQKEA
jgi:hypothetical protein